MSESLGGRITALNYYECSTALSAMEKYETDNMPIDCSLILY